MAVQVDDRITLYSKTKFNFYWKKMRKNIQKATNLWNLLAVVGWPAIFAPGCHTSRIHPALKSKKIFKKCTRLGTSPAIEDDFLLMLSTPLAQSKSGGSEIIERSFT